jgi:hypothetical protein
MHLAVSNKDKLEKHKTHTALDEAAYCPPGDYWNPINGFGGCCSEADCTVVWTSCLGTSIFGADQTSAW